MELSVVIPAYNEAHRIRSSVEQVSSFLAREHKDWEILVVDDGSAGDTGGALEGLPRVRCLRNEINRGKGYSVRRGVMEAQFDTILFTDADLSTPVSEASSLRLALDDGFDLAIGSRLRDQRKRVQRTPLRKLMAFGFRSLVKLLLVRGFHDTQCGFKMFRREAARKLFALQRLERWGFDVELLVLARKLGYRIAQVPVSYKESPESRLSWTTPLTMARDLLSIRWNLLRGRYDLRPGSFASPPGH